MDTVGCGEIELIFDPAPPLTLAGDTNISNIILAGTGSVNSSSSFSRVLVNSEQLIKSINVSTTDTNLASTNIVIDNNTGTIDLSFLCPSKPLFSTNFYGQSCRTNLEVCVTLENGSYCCDTTEVYYICNMIKYVKIFPNPDLGNDILNIYYELYDLPTMPIPLNITIYAQDGNKKWI